jgi:hypothetical protein
LHQLRSISWQSIHHLMRNIFEKWFFHCRTRHAWTFTIGYACSLQLSFIAYITIKVHIQHFSSSS